MWGWSVMLVNDRRGQFWNVRGDCAEFLAEFLRLLCIGSLGEECDSSGVSRYILACR